MALAIVVRVSGFHYKTLAQGVDFLFIVLVTLSGTILAGELVIFRSKELINGTINLCMAFYNGGWNRFWRNLKAGQMPK
uniref:Uncharacterized protein n=1 Tax=candidate division CPR3 bacterium TaxID=2268181 RepID=A0A7V3JAS3_UNCC3